MTIHIDADFDTGSLADWSVDGDCITLKPVPYQFNGKATGNWFALRLCGARGRTFTFQFDTSHCDLHGFTADNRCAISHDFAHWESIQTVHGFGNTYSFTCTIAHDEVWIAHTPAYSMQRVTQMVNNCLDHPAVSVPASAGDDGLIYAANGTAWRSPGGISPGGKTIPPQPLYAIAISESPDVAELPHIIAVSGNHAGEPMANYALEGLIDWWLSDKSAAIVLRQHTRLLVYPMVNPDGRYGGLVRGTPDLPQGDHNRLWSPDDNIPSISTIKQAIAQDSCGPVEFFLDFHNQERPHDQYMYVNTTMHYAENGKDPLPFIQRMLDDIPGFYLKLTESLRVAPGDTTCKSWAAAATDGPRARYSYTLEPGSPPVDAIAIARQYGSVVGHGISDHFRASYR